MKTYGKLNPDNSVDTVSLVLEDGEPLPQGIVPLVKLPAPAETSTHRPEPFIALAADGQSVERRWAMVERSSAELAARASKPDAPSWKVKVWLARQGIDMATISAIIEQQIPSGPQRTEALIRWENAPTVPFAHPLVPLIAAGLGLDPSGVWNEILAV